MKDVQIHFVDKDTNKLIRRKIASHVPSKGDELRFYSDVFYEVTLVVWVYDESECLFERVNIGVKRIDIGNQNE